jgi:hypothetical protein
MQFQSREHADHPGCFVPSKRWFTSFCWGRVATFTRWATNGGADRPGAYFLDGGCGVEQQRLLLKGVW